MTQRLTDPQFLFAIASIPSFILQVRGRSDLILMMVKTCSSRRGFILVKSDSLASGESAPLGLLPMRSDCPGRWGRWAGIGSGRIVTGTRISGCCALRDSRGTRTGDHGRRRRRRAVTNLEIVREREDRGGKCESNEGIHRDGGGITKEYCELCFVVGSG